MSECLPRESSSLRLSIESKPYAKPGKKHDKTLT